MTRMTSSIPGTPAASSPPAADTPDLVVAFGGRRPPITVLCGSTRFYETFREQNLRLTLAGHIVLSIGCDARCDGDVFGRKPGEIEEIKARLDELHLRKIDLADQVLVLNVGGYIGASTQAEISYAQALGTPVRYLEIPDSVPAAKVCDNLSVAVLIRDDTGRLLVFDRATFPPGVAVPAGHLDDHGAHGAHGGDRFEAAAVVEVAEEVGLSVVCLEYVTGGWRPNRCRRAPGPRGIGHRWRVFQATVTGELVPSRRETRNARWLFPAELQRLAERTAAYAHGRIGDAEFALDPGADPVQVQWLVDADLIEVGPEDLAVIDRIAARGHSPTC